MMPENNRYFLFLRYKGTNFHGWQIQPGSDTIQKTLDDTLSLVLREEIKTTGAGRTDAGVHALFFCAHFDSPKENIDKDNKLIFRLNRLLPSDIAVSSIKKVTTDANARFSALSRTYEYHITRTKDPFRTEYAWYVHGALDVTTMNEACSILLKYSDFTSFARLHSDNKTNICRLMSASWTETENSLVFTIRADRFLRNMVRAITGTMIEIGFGKLSLDDFKDIINARDRGKAGKSAPARGLFLTDIEYPEVIFK